MKTIEKIGFIIRKYVLSAVGLMALFVICGCASISYRPIGQSGAADVSVYMIREMAEPPFPKLNIYLDGDRVAEVANKSFVGFSCPPGNHKILLKWPSWSSQISYEKTVTFERGNSYYFKVNGECKVTQDGNIQRIHESLGMEIISEEKGQMYMQKLGR